MICIMWTVKSDDQALAISKGDLLVLETHFSTLFQLVLQMQYSEVTLQYRLLYSVKFSI